MYYSKTPYEIYAQKSGSADLWKAFVQMDHIFHSLIHPMEKRTKTVHQKMVFEQVQGREKDLYYLVSKMSDSTILQLICPGNSYLVF